MIYFSIFPLPVQSGRATQRYNSLLRRHASLSIRGGQLSAGGSRWGPDTKSVRSLRSLQTEKIRKISMHSGRSPNQEDPLLKK